MHTSCLTECNWRERFKKLSGLLNFQKWFNGSSKQRTIFLNQIYIKPDRASNHDVGYFLKVFNVYLYNVNNRLLMLKLNVLLIKTVSTIFLTISSLLV